MITKNTLLPLVYLIGILVIVEIIWLLIWGLKKRRYKTNLFISIVISIIINILSTFTIISDWILVNSDLLLHSQDRLEVVKETLKVFIIIIRNTSAIIQAKIGFL
jgi:hypothetical protein